MKKISFLTLVAAIFLAACQPKPAAVDINAEAQAIRNLEDQWTIASREKNLEKIVSLFAPDGIVMEANRPIAAGTEAIRKIQESLLSDTTILWENFKVTIDFVEVASSGDLGYTRGTYTQNLKMPKETVESVGKWIDIWKKINGEWKCIVAISNSDKPLEEK